MSKIKSNYEIISDKANDVPVTSTQYIKHGDDWLDSVVEESKNNYVTPEMFGAVGDGATDDTEAIQNFFNSGVGTTLVGTHGRVYKITSTVFVPYGVYFNGADCIFLAAVSSVTRTDDFPSKVAFWLEDSHGNPKNPVMQNFSVDCGDEETVALYLGAKEKFTPSPSTINRSVYNILLKNIKISNCGTGIQMSEVWMSSVENVSISAKVNGILVAGQTVNVFFSNCHISAGNMGVKTIMNTRYALRAEGLTFSNCFIGEADYGVVIRSGLLINFSNCIIDLNHNYALYCVDATQCNFNGCYLYSTGEHCVYFDRQAGNNNTRVSFLQSSIINSNAAKFAIWLDINNKGISASDCSIQGKVQSQTGSVLMINNNTFGGSDANFGNGEGEIIGIYNYNKSSGTIAAIPSVGNYSASRKDSINVFKKMFGDNRPIYSAYLTGKDFNNVATDYAYSFLGFYDGTCTNKPPGGFGFVINMFTDANTISQICLVNDGRLYSRFCSSGNWTQWVSYALKSEIPT